MPFCIVMAQQLTVITILVLGPFLLGMTQSRRGTRPPTQGSEARTGLYLEETLQDTRPSQDQAER